MPLRDQRWLMQTAPTVFTPITNVRYAAEFSRCVGLAPTTRPTRSLTAYDHCLARWFAPLTDRDSLREVVACRNARRTLLDHLGFRGRLSRTNLADANRHRDWRLFAAVAHGLIRRAARRYQDEPAATDLPAVALALDSAIISLALNLFPWGYYARSRLAALNLHLLRSLQGHLPAWAAVTEAHFPDLKFLDRIPARAGAY